MYERLLGYTFTTLLLGSAASAFAYDGFAVDTVNLRAGPDIAYNDNHSSKYTGDHKHEP